jgi:hypothetical protein
MDMHHHDQAAFVSSNDFKFLQISQGKSIALSYGTLCVFNPEAILVLK